MKKILLPTLLAAALLTSCSKDRLEINGHEAVNLGLTSGVLWATCNIGADSPEKEGDPFAWGETETKKTGEEQSYSWDDYKFFAPPTDGSRYGTLTKYCRATRQGVTDHKIELDLEDDAANVKWGDDWCIPTKAQFEELVKECTWELDTQDGVNGYTVTGKNEQSIFLPFAQMQDAFHEGGVWPAADGNSCYWLRELEYTDNNDSYRAALMVLAEHPKVSYARRHKGVPIRPVYDPNKKKKNNNKKK